MSSGPYFSIFGVNILTILKWEKLNMKTLHGAFCFAILKGNCPNY